MIEDNELLEKLCLKSNVDYNIVKELIRIEKEYVSYDKRWGIFKRLEEYLEEKLMG